jgi:signal transduction histidine kinase
MKLSRSSWFLLAAWAVFVGGYAVVSLLLKPGPALTVFGDVTRCLVPLFANACLLWNAGSPYKRRNAFWMLLALGCTIWLVAQMVWTYEELVLHLKAPSPFAGDMIFFLHTIPLMASLALQPHARRLGKTLRYGYLDLLLLAMWWVYLYAYIVTPWQLVSANAQVYQEKFFQIYLVEDLIFLIGLAVFCLRTKSGWRTVYANLFGAAFLYTLANLVISWMGSMGKYYTGSLFDVPLVASVVWFGTAGVVAHRLDPVPDPETAARKEYAQGPARLAMIGVLSMPALAIWGMFFSEAPEPVRQYRLLVTLVAVLLGATVVFFRQYLVEQDRLRLLRESQESVENLKRLQTQYVQSEKLVSLGQLAAGAAHEINNPLTAILGYADMLVEASPEEERTRSLAQKIREQARRVKTLVTSLQSFARQVPGEKQLLDLSAIVASAVQLRTLDLRDKNIRIDLQNRSVLPAVRGDPNQLLQVFYHLISNAVDAMEEVGGGVLVVRALRERSNVVVEFSDTGPGIREPHRVFDPFYTTKPVGKGTGLGLSICYGIVQEHGGRILGYNRSEGGTTFRIELPAVLALFPQAPTAASPPPQVNVS